MVGAGAQTSEGAACCAFLLDQLGARAPVYSSLRHDINIKIHDFTLLMKLESADIGHIQVVEVCNANTSFSAAPRSNMQQRGATG